MVPERPVKLVNSPLIYEDAEKLVSYQLLPDQARSLYRVLISC